MAMDAANLSDVDPADFVEQRGPSRPDSRPRSAVPRAPSRAAALWKSAKSVSAVVPTFNNIREESAHLDSTAKKTRAFAPHIKWDFHVQRNIVRYDARALFSWGFLQMWTATVITWGLIAEVVVLCAVASVFGYFRCDPQRTDIRPAARDFKNWTICVPLENSQALTIASLAAFLLSLFTNLVFSRYWQTRNLLQQVFGRTPKTISMLYAHIAQDDESMAIASHFARYLQAALAFMHKQTRTLGRYVDDGVPESVAASPRTYDDMVRDGLVTEDELECLRSVHNKWQIMYVWAMRILNELQKKGKITAAGPNITALIQQSLQDTQYAVSEVMAVMTTPIPYPYTHLLSLMTKFHLIFMTLYASSVVGAGFLNMQAERIILGYLIIAFNVLIFEGILTLYVQLENPLGFDPCDFPVTNYRMSVQADAAAITRSVSTAVPETLKRLAAK